MRDMLLGALILAACVVVDVGMPTTAFPAERWKPGTVQTGMASFYGPESGRVTANSERFRWGPGCRTAAHRRLPFGTMVRVTRLPSGPSIVVRINDRGPYAKGRIIDLCQGAGHALGMKASGVARVRVEVLR